MIDSFVEKCARRWAFPAMAGTVVVVFGLSYLLFLMPSETYGLFFCYATVMLALLLCCAATTVCLLCTGWLLWRRRYGKAAYCAGSYLAVYVVAFFAIRYAVILWVFARTGW